MKYKIVISKTYSGEDFIKIRNRVDYAIDDFWYFVEDCPNQEVRIYKNSIDVTEDVKLRVDLRNKYYKGLDGCLKHKGD